MLDFNAYRFLTDWLKAFYRNEAGLKQISNGTLGKVLKILRAMLY